LRDFSIDGRSDGGEGWRVGLGRVERVPWPRTVRISISETLNSFFLLSFVGAEIKIESGLKVLFLAIKFCASLEENASKKSMIITNDDVIYRIIYESQNSQEKQ
jgi:hypothetical protein